MLCLLFSNTFEARGQGRGEQTKKEGENSEEVPLRFWSVLSDNWSCVSVVCIHDRWERKEFSDIEEVCDEVDSNSWR